MKKLILSVDGGGVRGIIPAMALARLEQITGKPARETVSFVAGTSTGSLIAASVAAGVPASQMVNVYLQRCKEIFTPGAPWNVLKRVVTGEQYSSAKLRTVVAETLGTAAAWTLNLSPIDLLITAVDVSSSKPWYFVRDNPLNSKHTGGLNLVDCAVASASAPTYFPPCNVVSCGTLVDGGVGVTGNPVYQACVEAFCYHDGYQPENTVVVSLGTGYYTAAQHPSGLLGWLEWTINTLLDAPEDQQTELVQRHYAGPTQAQFFRANPLLTYNIPMDDVGSMSTLAEVGKAFAVQVPWETILAKMS